MAKLRKMLGDIRSQVCQDLMAQIASQSKGTLAAWAVGYARERYLPIYERACPGDGRLGEIVTCCEDYVNQNKKLAEIKPALREARLLAGALDGEPLGQAAARAVATACAAVQTPTNALGFLFYGAAAVAYGGAGLEASQTEYDDLAAAELERALASLRSVSVSDEPNPARINWNC